MNIEWYNAKIDRPPTDQQEVLLSANGIYTIAVYFAALKYFVERDNPLMIYDPAQRLLYWSRIRKIPLRLDGLL